MITPENIIILAYPTITINVSSFCIRFIPKKIKNTAITIPNNGKFFIVFCLILKRNLFLN